MIHTKTYPAPPVCEREILRYAGCREADPETEKLLQSCLEESLPRLCYRVCWLDMEETPDFGSVQLQASLSGCEHTVLFAATVGVELDRLLQKYSILSPARALMLQAIGTERIEALCDAFCADLQEQTGLCPRNRFSPGYGDLPLQAQKDIFAILQPMKHIGLALNDSLLMSPSKSVTAFVGLAAEEPKTISKCSRCGKTDCIYRRTL